MCKLRVDDVLQKLLKSIQNVNINPIPVGGGVKITPPGVFPKKLKIGAGRLFIF